MSLSFSAAVLNGIDRPLDIETLELPESPPAGEVLVELVASGLCFSDLHVMKGDWATPTPLVLGHEGAGIVRAVGTGMRTLAEGDHVVLCWTPSCRSCRFCVIGRPSLCDVAKAKASKHVMPDGTTRLTSQGRAVHSYIALGTFGQYTMVQENAAIRIRPDVPLAQASLVGCAVTTGIGAVINTAKVEAGASVIVVGCGGVGLNVLQGARLAAAHPIVAVDREPGKLEAARRFGATHTINSADVDLPDAVAEMTGGRGFDYGFEAIGLSGTTEDTIASIGKGGTAVLVGQVATGQRISVDPLVISDQEKVIRGSNYGSARPAVDFPRILDLYTTGLIDLDSLITQTVALTQINVGFDAMRNRSGIRTVVDFHSSGRARSTAVPKMSGPAGQSVGDPP
jgi:S-(hydroxymethyl)glutathione dehydrogenase/alcohol dehydrogenase